MERDEFLKTLGISLALVCAGTCFESCGKKGDGDPDPATGNGNQVSVDISALASVGSQTTSNGVLFFRVAPGNAAASFIATQALCTHANGQLNWVQSSNKIQCSSHGATFGSDGTVSSQPIGGGTALALKVYALNLAGTQLTATKS
ncbi:MAG: Rieske 2Fe-2S domain-containing protein [Sphingobacteriaceae bacterium]|nr:Rieske 2Fe-2S domain-containing protein [Sphingobacteriaceae bacterium]